MWGLIVLLAAMVVITSGYHTLRLRLERQHEQYRQESPEHQLLMETPPQSRP